VSVPKNAQAQPEEMQRRGIVRPAQAARRPDEQREDADGGQNEVEIGGARRRRRQSHVQHLLLAKAQDR
jgi:hypothetical protein